MRCPFCHSLKLRVVDKRQTEDKEAVRRRRLCESCNKRFTTYERIEKIQLKVLKKDGRLEDYRREKVKAGILKAIEKRPVNEELVEELIDEIEGKLLARRSTEVSSADIGRMILTRLKKLDEVAYLRFASVFLGFESTQDFKKAIAQL